LITRERVRLRAPSRDDIPRFVVWLNDPEVRQGLSLYLPLSMDEEQAWFENMIKRPAEERPMVIEIRSGESWTPVGNCGFHQVDWRNRSGEVGIFIGEKTYWNQGIGTEVMVMLVEHGFATLNMNRIFLRVFADNLRAIRSYEKTGFVHEGRMRQAEYHGGQYVDVLFMSILRSEWQDRQGVRPG
jgi:RimJ/RimL family protein N-acetyltransferase